MIKPKNIVRGWWNLATDNAGANEMAEERAKHCVTCDHAVHKQYLDVVDDKVEIIKGYLCDICGCPLSAKLRSPEEHCPDEPSKW